VIAYVYRFFLLVLYISIQAVRTRKKGWTHVVSSATAGKTRDVTFATSPTVGIS